MYKTMLKAVLIERGIKQTWLAKKVDVHQTVMTRIVNGRQLPDVALALRIARELNMTVEDLWPVEKEDETNSAKN